MDNISGDALYTSDQDLADERLANKTTGKVKKDKAIVKQPSKLKAIKKKSIELHKSIEDEYKVAPTKKLYDALVSAQGVVEVFRDIE